MWESYEGGNVLKHDVDGTMIKTRTMGKERSDMIIMTPDSKYLVLSGDYGVMVLTGINPRTCTWIRSVYTKSGFLEKFNITWRKVMNFFPEPQVIRAKSSLIAPNSMIERRFVGKDEVRDTLL